MQEVAKQARDELLKQYNAIYDDFYKNGYNSEQLEKAQKELLY